MPHAQDGAPSNIVFAGGSQGAMFATPVGDPIPPSDVVKALAAISPRLKIEWVGGAYGACYFALKERWKEGDVRWARVQSGELPEANAFDVLTMFPREVRTGDMIAWISSKWGDRAFAKDPRAEAERLIEQAKKLMAEADASHVDAAVETGTRRILDENDHLRLVRAGVERAHPMVHGADLSGEPKRLLAVG